MSDLFKDGLTSFKFETV